MIHLVKPTITLDLVAVLESKVLMLDLKVSSRIIMFYVSNACTKLVLTENKVVTSKHQGHPTLEKRIENVKIEKSYKMKKRIVKKRKEKKRKEKNTILDSHPF